MKLRMRMRKVRTFAFRMLGCKSRYLQRARFSERVTGFEKFYRRLTSRFIFLYYILSHFNLTSPRRALTPCMPSPSSYRSSLQLATPSAPGALLNTRDSALTPTPAQSRQQQPYVGGQHLPFRESTNTQGHQLRPCHCPRHNTRIESRQDPAVDITVCERIYDSRASALLPYLQWYIWSHHSHRPSRPHHLF